MKDKLGIVEENYVYRIKWFIAGDEWDSGAILGQESKEELIKMRETWNALIENTASASLDPETLEHIAATIGALESAVVDSTGFYWESMFGARRAIAQANGNIRLARDVLETNTGKSYSGWEKIALSHGWKPPKGWIPGSVV